MFRRLLVIARWIEPIGHDETHSPETRAPVCFAELCPRLFQPLDPTQMNLEAFRRRAHQASLIESLDCVVIRSWCGHPRSYLSTRAVFARKLKGIDFAI